MKLRAAIVACLVAAGALPSTWSADMSTELTGLVHDILPADASSASPKASTITSTAAVMLQEDHLMGSGRPTIAPNNLIEQYSKALALGTRGPQFATEIAAIHNAFQGRDPKAVRDAVRTLMQNAGRSAPDNESLDKMVNALQEAEAPSDPAEYAVISKPDHSVEITWLKPTGQVKVEVINNKGPDGKATRTVFQGEAVSQPDPSGKGFQTVGKPRRDQLRTVTEESSQALRDKIGGKWKDQSGNLWLVSGGKSTGILLTQYYSNGHKVEYMGDYKLAKISASHTIKDPKDIREDMPESVKQQLATKWQPPYKLRLDVNDAADRMEGTWISRHVTYSGLSGEVESVSNDDFHQPLILTRAVLSGTAMGMKEGDFP